MVSKRLENYYRLTVFFRGLDLIVGNLEGAISQPFPPNKEIDFDFDDEEDLLDDDEDVPYN